MAKHFLIQKDSPLSVENLQLKEEINAVNARMRFIKIADYNEISLEHLSSFNRPGYIPIGSIEFVQKYLSIAYNISTMPPIEIPEVLRKPEFLLRDYNIVPYDKIPSNGRYFVKDVSKLKSFSFSGDINYLLSNEFHEQINKNHIFQVSSLLDILAEYRVIVIDDKIEAIQFYNGEPTIMPTEKEIIKIKKMVYFYLTDTNRPEAYTFDVAIVRNGNERDLALIEVHPAISIGTYGYAGQKLIDMYEKGFSWYLKQKGKEI